MALGNPDRPVGGLAVRPPAGVELRPLGRDDFDLAARLLLELHRGAPADAAVERLRPGWDRFIASVDSVSFVAVADGEPVGIVAFRFRRRLNWATYEGWLSDWYVVPPQRGKGIGRALVDAALAEWRLRGGHQVMIELPYDATAARDLAARVGFGEQGRWFVAEPITPRGISPRTGVEVRPIAAGDFQAVTRLLAELGRPAPSDERLPALRRSFDDHLRRAETASLLATLEGDAVGFCSLEFRDRLHRIEPEAWIPDLVVTEAARGRRIGAALLDAAFAEAVARGAAAVTLESGFQRAAAHSLYAAAGMGDVGSFFTLPRPDR